MWSSLLYSTWSLLVFLDFFSINLGKFNHYPFYLLLSLLLLLLLICEYSLLSSSGTSITSILVYLMDPSLLWGSLHFFFFFFLLWLDLCLSSSLLILSSIDLNLLLSHSSEVFSCLCVFPLLLCFLTPKFPFDPLFIISSYWYSLLDVTLSSDLPLLL